MKAACNTRTFPHRSLRGAPRLWDGAAGSRPQGRAAHTAPAHTSAAGAPVSPAARWDFCTPVLPLLVLSPAPFPHRSAQFPHRSAQFPHRSAPLSHRSRADPAVLGTPGPYVCPSAPQDQEHPKRVSEPACSEEEVPCQPDRRCCWDCSKQGMPGSRRGPHVQNKNF